MTLEEYTLAWQNHADLMLDLLKSAYENFLSKQQNEEVARGGEQQNCVEG